MLIEDLQICMKSVLARSISIRFLRLLILSEELDMIQIYGLKTDLLWLFRQMIYLS